MKINPIKLIYPQRCRYCRSVVDIRRSICEKCENDLPKIQGEICRLCGAAIAECHCGHKKHFYKYVCAPFYYGGAVSKAIHLLKFSGKTKVIDTLAEDMLECFKSRYEGYDFDLCTFVPSAKEDYKSRGFNQAELLARRFCEISGLGFADLLAKPFQTPSQHLLNKIERSGNLVGAIELREGADVENMRILLIDDIKTTGATLNECAKILRINGAAEVFCLTAAITNK